MGTSGKMGALRVCWPSPAHDREWRIGPCGRFSQVGFAAGQQEE
jgi:hypothetical protein